MVAVGMSKHNIVEILYVVSFRVLNVFLYVV